MKARIITIGDELMIGQVVNTNSSYIARRLNDAGINVEKQLTIGDDPVMIRVTVDIALKACDLVITTGGLGPTRDDITKGVVAELFNSPLTEHLPTSEHIERLLAARGIEFNALNRSQALVPAVAQVLQNDNGTAPGLWLERAGSILVMLPGVPFEMEALMEQKVMPRLNELSGGRGIYHRTMVTSGIPESILAEKIAPWEDSLPGSIKLAYLPSPSGVRLRLSAYNIRREHISSVIGEKFAELEKIIPGAVVGYDDQTAEGRVAELLNAGRATLAVAESCTGGELAARFTAMPGASKYFLFGAVTYSNESKSAVLGVDRELLKEHGAVSREVAEKMALGARRIGMSDYALATTGIAGPDGGSPEKPVGTVWIALATPQGVKSSVFNFGNLRRQNIERAVTAALNMLREELSVI